METPIDLTPHPNSLHIHTSTEMLFNADRLYFGIIFVLILTIGTSAAPLKRDVSSLAQLAPRSILNKPLSVLVVALQRRQLRSWVPPRSERNSHYFGKAWRMYRKNNSAHTLTHKMWSALVAALWPLAWSNEYDLKDNLQLFSLFTYDPSSLFM